ncbi:MAG: hypothetical protein JSR17_06800 [Proteobacteria bacterium]|nr:hypothetical protein [Pseudomonadota bacterium]
MRKMPKLASTCLSSLLFGLIPSLSYALGLGEIKIESHLNEPLVAQIPLEDIKGIDHSDIVTSLADTSAFAKAGLEPANWIYHIQFSILTDKQGKTVIKLTTQHPVQDPFADLLIQVNWPGGKIVREYTVLLDPPSVVMTQPRVSSHKAQAIFKALAQDTPQQAPRQVASLVKQQFNAVLTDAQNNEPLQFGGQFGPVQGETLWSIARRLVENTHFSIHQAVMAIAYKNPDAFVNGNINQIKQGAVLRLPSQNELKKYSPEKAKHFVENQIQYGHPLVVHAEKAVERKHKQPVYHEEVSDKQQTAPTPAPEQTQKALKIVAPIDEIHAQVKKDQNLSSFSDSSLKEASQKILADEALDTMKRTHEEMTQKYHQLQTQNDALVAEINRLKMGVGNGSLHTAQLPREVPTKTTMPSHDYAVVTPDPTEAERRQLHNKPPEDATLKKTKLQEPQHESASEFTTSNTKHSEVMKRNFVFIVFMFAFTSSLLGWLWFTRHRLVFVAKWFNQITHKINNIKKHRPAKVIADISDLPQEEIQVNYGLQFDLDKALNAVTSEERKFLKPTVNVVQNKDEKETTHKKSQASLEDAEIYIAYERYQQAEKILQDMLTHDNSQDPIYWDALLKLLELYVLTEKYSDYEKWYATVPSELKELSPQVWSKIALLQEKVQAEKAISLSKEVSGKSKEDEGMILATHHLEEGQLPTPQVTESPFPASNLTLVSLTDEDFDAQITLAKTYKEVGDLNAAKEVLEKLLKVTQGEQKTQVENLIIQINKARG